MRQKVWLWALGLGWATRLWAGMGYWTWLGPVMDSVTALYASPTSLYAALESQGLFRFDYATQSWDTLQAPGAPIRAIYVHPANPQDLLVGIDASSGVTVWRSLDGGQSWIPSDSGLTAPGLSDVLPVRDLTGTSECPDTVFLATLDGVWMSPDFGAHWVYVFGDDSTYYYNGRTLTQASPETLYLGSQSFVFEGQVWRSVDRGQTWEFLWGTYSVGGEGLLNGISQHPMTPSLLLVAVGGLFVPGIYRSTDGGTTFTPTYSQWANAVLFHPQDSSTAYAATDANGVLRSPDAGLTWVPINDSLPINEVNLLAFEPESQTLFIGTPLGVYAYTDVLVAADEKPREPGVQSSPLLLLPNPAHGQLTVQLRSGQIQSITVHTLDGRRLGEIIHVPGPSWQVNLQPYAIGPSSFFLRIQTTHGIFTQKVLVVP